MGFITEPVQQIIGGISGAATGKGPAGLDPGRINAAAFTDPNAETNKRLLEAQRLQMAQQGTAGQLNQGQTRTQQQGLITALQNRASGATPSIAEMQLARSADQNRQALASQAASTPNVSAGLAQRNLARTQAQVGQDTAGQAALLRAQEQQAAEQSLAGVLGQTRTLDQASAQQANDLALKYMQLGLGVDQAQFLANQELEKLKSGMASTQAQVGAQQQGAVLGGLGSLGAAALLSDENQKENIKSSDKDVSKFLKALDAKSYDYKNHELPGAAEGKRFGIIAQDLEKSEMGKSLVSDTPNGKMIDSNQAIGALLASVSSLNKRLEKVGA